ncbi:MAG TPA: bifunctional diaminohydroxyphosphoribosylaminopyrimidine deaminase/5-amino-6-(5-phosphoribosylamino)uracil reductase RibD [Chitinophagaceae bacterium]|nr:bifunctional diaminohydroxyphosphoribosylaminopyrimidine deaminase/5-amino-6-(5-phosphoribosylamino)uracil reductase RibD [Chitinophagaceae bacterium]
MTRDSRLTTHDFFMYRCLQLAENGAGFVAPNPMVGAILVHENKIIGEGYHEQYGGPHAEVNCINSVHADHRDLISHSTLYVSLEPCAHFGKTPPCSELIMANQIPEVVIGCRDPFKEVNGKGIEKLQAGGVTVIQGVLEQECKRLNKRFFTFHTQHRPYIILKWAESADRRMSANGAERLLITNEQTNRLVHKWRSEEASILVGTNTALCDDPELTTRYWNGPSPIRLVVDMDLRLPASLKLFNGNQATIVFNTREHSEELESFGTPSPLVEREGARYYHVTEDVNLVHQILNALYQLKIQSVLVEGGARLLQSFIDEDMWDEVRIISNTQLTIGNGLAAPELETPNLEQEFMIQTDSVKIYSK